MVIHLGAKISNSRMIYERKILPHLPIFPCQFRYLLCTSQRVIVGSCTTATLIILTGVAFVLKQGNVFWCEPPKFIFQNDQAVGYPQHLSLTFPCYVE